MVVVSSAGRTDVGRKRKGNEDSFFLDDGLRFYVVADGMGGHKAGEVASKMVVESLRDHMEAFQDKRKAGEVTTIDNSLSKEANHLVAGIHQANLSIYQKAQNSEEHKGMGSTVSAVCLTDNSFILSNVGDSPIYLIRDESVEEVSTPHTWAAEHAAIAPEGAKPLAKKFQHMLTRAMGVDESVEPDTREISMLKGDIIVICSDGLSDNVSPEETRDIVIKEPPQQASQSLVNLSNERRGHDNITVIVLKVEEVSDDISPPEKDEPLIEWAEELKPFEIEESPIEGKDDIPRKKGKIAVEYDTEDGSYRSFVRSIGLESVFIETGESFAVGQEIMMSFSTDDERDFLMVSGSIINRNPEGIEVKFEDLSPEDQDMIKTLM